jgi:hypothetical protein
LVNRVKNFWHSSEGSAISEFILFALPLFLPLALVITTLHEGQTINYQANVLARNILRIYQTGDTQEHVDLSINLLLAETKTSILPESEFRTPPTIFVTCQTQPCLKPGNLIDVTVTLYPKSATTSITQSEKGYVDAWSTN